MRVQSQTKPTILFLVPGEIQRQTGGSIYDRKLLDRLTERGFQPDLVTVPDLPYLAGLLAGLVVSPLLLLKIVRRKYDVVIEDGWAHPTTLLFNVVCWLGGRIRLVILVHQVRWCATRPPAKYAVRVAEKVALRSARLIVTVSRFIGAEVERLVGSSAQVVVAPPGSAPLPDNGSERDTLQQSLRLLFVGNCTRLKGLDHLMAALGMLRELPLKLDVVGDVSFEPRYFKRLVRQAEALGIRDSVTFHGAVAREGLGGFYSQADIFTFPSLYEGFGIVLAEAMHAGLPIVSTRTGPAGEILHEGENALIVPPADSACLANAIRTLASNPDLREKFGRRSRELASSLPTWEQTCDNICHQIEIISQRTPGTKQRMKTTPTL